MKALIDILINLYLFFILITFIKCQTVKTNVTRPCNRQSGEQVDEIISKIITIGNTGRKFPESREQIPGFCKETLGLVNEANSFSKDCLDQFSKQFVSVLTYTFQSQVKFLCLKNSKRLDQLIDASTCVNNGNHEMHKCNVKLIDAYLGIQNVVDHKIKIPLLCCEFYKMTNCMRNRLRRTKDCTEKRIDVLIRFIESLTGRGFELMCGELDEGSDRCRAFVTPKRKKGQRRSKSFLLPLLRVLLSLPE